MYMPVSQSLWLVLSVTALVSRLAAALLLPNAEQDGYSYAEIITQWSTGLSTGNFCVAGLFGFWLPLFPLAAAIPNIWIGHSLLLGKMLSALCGATSCLLVFTIVRSLTRSIALALLGFAILVTSPLHILYSAACMTDVPAGCLILASLWFVLQRHWVVAAIFGALAGGVRMEAWVLLPLLPMLQFVYERRISILVVAILLLPVLACLGVSELATGHSFTFFVNRARYQANYMDFYPTRHHFTFPDVLRDLDYFFLGANRGVVLAAVTAGVLLIWRAVQRRERLRLTAAAPLGYAAALLGLVVVAYMTKQQPVLFPRYGLMLFAVGLPLFMWLLRDAFQSSIGSWVPKVISVAAIVICFWEGKRQLPIISKVMADYRARRQIAETLAIALHQSPGSGARCFSDDAAVRVLSELPTDRFLRSQSAPPSVWLTAASFESYLRQNHVSYLVFTRIENSLPAKFFPEIGRDAPGDHGIFEFLAFAPSPFAPDVWLFRIALE
jgi:hypothetical protein